MYDIYASRKWTYLIPVFLFWGLVPVFLFIIVKDCLSKGFSFSTIMGLVCVCMVAVVGYIFWTMFRIDPYKNIKKLKASDPTLVAQMEADFENSQMVCPHIWRGRSFYYFEGSLYLLVVPIGGVQSFSMKKDYRKSIGTHYDCQVRSLYGEAEFAVANLNPGSENLLDVANEIAAESGIILQILK